MVTKGVALQEEIVRNDPMIVIILPDSGAFILHYIMFIMAYYVVFRSVN